ncbi:hypothetical protein VSX64_24610 [Aurantimonas sp. C2-6-R+9]|uniref:hypothetical protein n=1 Tax=unclassified Aurantimonas TaxID=2638230 RepID=UPI002E172BF4|nr:MULTISPECIES: hypothetical protein [unclassified Aurantimonas]MEC5293752.1 hypothetical protein [Aurantimonas sp. C2-3-R2]MEC5383896.1 hypothetical protein [Aurantimonas sp. C2-6-R+9]MEC5414811.1 hypothetical protein [Aurantimonas sp. C2-4-R8]
MTCKISMLGTAIALAALTEASVAEESDATYAVELSPLNAEAAGTEARGTGTLTVSGDTLTVRVDAKGTSPNIMHLQHFHVFTEGDAASACPTADSDTNGDGIIDLIETEPGAGITMVPFHADPPSMEIVADSYPVADAQGTYAYEQSVSLSSLKSAFAEKFPGQQLDLEQRVLFLHGVPEGIELPETVQSLGDVPAQTTLPIACGEIRQSDS